MNIIYRATFLIALLLITYPSHAQRTSCPEKWWAVKHFLIAPKAYALTKNARKATQRIINEGLLDSDSQGGQADAFRHCYWMALLSQRFKPKKVMKLGIAHEKGNYIDFKKGRSEDGILPDMISGAMDLYNNQKGVEIGYNLKSVSKDSLAVFIISEIKEGEMRVIYKDETGNYLNCKGVEIMLADFEGKWFIPKCLVPSNQGRK